MKSLKVRDAIHGTVEVTKVFPGDIIAEERDLTQDHSRSQPKEDCLLDTHRYFIPENFGGVQRRQYVGKCRHPLVDPETYIGEECKLLYPIEVRPLHDGWPRRLESGTKLKILSQDPYEIMSFIVQVIDPGFHGTTFVAKISDFVFELPRTPKRLTIKEMLEELLQVAEVKFGPMPDGRVFVSVFPKDLGWNWFYEIGTLEGALEALCNQATELKLLPPLNRR